ncbi:MAG TPA: N-6 DNA methylase [Terriglobia bacterium]|nr:N-6 DNA methylase [Terriglobia bacterium]
MSIATFHSDLEKLIRKFEGDQQHYSSKDYLEAQARTDFLTPFFKALGWDVENEAGLLHHDREVLVERGDMEATGRPDYNFRIGGQTKFYVEAKAPSEPLATPRHILQAKGYVWNTKSVYFVILTNFEEFRFYDASAQPDPKRPDEGLLLSLRYSDYPANAEKLWEFSRERVAAGSLEALLPKIRRAPRLRKQVDDVFLDEMTGWREELAKNIHKNNPELTARQLNEVVQRLLDRVVFIRIAEDRKVLEYGQLRRVLEDWGIHGGKFHIFDWLNDLFHKVNEDFNGEIFKPHLSETIKIDSELLARIIKRLYPPESPYRFDVIGVELLGSIYERYLGNTIRLTPKQVKVEEKPEVRKAGGVYYTPRYIVDYIVRETVGKAIEGKSPKQIEKIRILDPACGSGSFLIGAFQYLIDYHIKWYLAHPEQEVRHAHPSLDFMREVHTDPDGAKRLSVYRKAKILRNSLFGVDIDPQAVEITMMSLYLKALEGEKSQLPPKQHILPELKYNIMCGNSLIGPDIYDQGMLFAEDERDRINAFDWNFVPGGVPRASPPVNEAAQGDAPSERRGGSRTAPTPGAAPPSIGQIMRSGGFDCVIGNPPYGAMLGEEDIAYLRKRYATATSELDTYGLFIEKATNVCKSQGRISMIIPTGWYSGVRFSPLRRFVACHTDPEDFVNLPYDVFEAWVDTTVFVGAKRAKALDWPRQFPCNVTLRTFPKRHKIQAITEFDEESKAVELTTWFANRGDEFLTYADTASSQLMAEVQNISKPIKDFADIQRGVTPFNLTDAPDHKHSVRAFAGTVRRYSVELGERKFIRFDDTLAEPKPERYFKGPRLLLRELISRKFELQAVKVTEDFVTNKSMQSILPLPNSLDLNYLLGCLNSRLLSWYFLRRSNIAQRDDFPKIVLKETRDLPIRPVNLSDPADKARHDKMVELVDRMLELNKQKHSGKLAPSQVERIDREIAATDAEIDNLVYDLYGVTQQERKTIEER